MICTPETYQPAPPVLGLAITTLSHESKVEEICEGLDTNALGFDPQAEGATLHEAEEFRSSLLLSQAFTAYLHEHPVGAGMFTEIHEGLTELVGITTVARTQSNREASGSKGESRRTHHSVLAAHQESLAQ